MQDQPQVEVKVADADADVGVGVDTVVVVLASVNLTWMSARTVTLLTLSWRVQVQKDVVGAVQGVGVENAVAGVVVEVEAVVAAEVKPYLQRCRTCLQ